MNAHLTSVARLACLALVSGLVLSGCGDEGIALRDLRKFDAYPLYYAGEEVAGNELEEILGAEDWERNPDQRSVGFTFIYGTCEPSEPSGLDGGSCAPPIQIQVSSICVDHPGRAGGKGSTFALRGARAVPAGGGVEVFTGRTTVDVYASGDPRLLKAVIRSLREVGQAAPPRRLPPPVPGAVEGKLPCQQKRG